MPKKIHMSVRNTTDVVQATSYHFWSRMVRICKFGLKKECTAWKRNKIINKTTREHTEWWLGHKLHSNNLLHQGGKTIPGYLVELQSRWAEPHDPCNARSIGAFPSMNYIFLTVSANYTQERDIVVRDDEFVTAETKERAYVSSFPSMKWNLLQTVNG